jgi:hypothetical protein
MSPFLQIPELSVCLSYSSFNRLAAFNTLQISTAHTNSSPWHHTLDWLASSWSQSYIMTDGQSASLSQCQAPSGSHDQFFFFFNFFRELRVCWYKVPCQFLSLQLFLGLASTVFLESKSHEIHYHIFSISNLRLWTWWARFLYLFPPGTRWLSYTPRHRVLTCLSCLSSW